VSFFNPFVVFSLRLCYLSSLCRGYFASFVTLTLMLPPFFSPHFSVLFFRISRKAPLGPSGICFWVFEGDIAERVWCGGQNLWGG
jgi:hypothetical protein